MPGPLSIHDWKRDGLSQVGEYIHPDWLLADRSVSIAVVFLYIAVFFVLDRNTKASQLREGSRNVLSIVHNGTALLASLHTLYEIFLTLKSVNLLDEPSYGTLVMVIPTIIAHSKPLKAGRMIWFFFACRIFQFFGSFFGLLRRGPNGFVYSVCFTHCVNFFVWRSLAEDDPTRPALIFAGISALGEAIIFSIFTIQSLGIDIRSAQRTSTTIFLLTTSINAILAWMVQAETKLSQTTERTMLLFAISQTFLSFFFTFNLLRPEQKPAVQIARLRSAGDYHIVDFQFGIGEVKTEAPYTFKVSRREAAHHDRDGHESIMPLLFHLTLAVLVILVQTSRLELSFSQDISKTSRNPFRGFVSFSQTTNPKTTAFPTSMEFTYIAMSSINPADGSYDWTVIEELANAAAGRGNHLVFRIHTDFPGLGSSLPQYLTQGRNRVKTFPYSAYGGGYSPDYSDTRLLSAMVALIENLGRQYDGDHRIASIQIGLLGFWGEWHTTVDEGLKPPFAPRDVQLAVLNAWSTSFNSTMLVNTDEEYQYWSTAEDESQKSGQDRFVNIGRFDCGYGMGSFNESDPENPDHFYHRTVSSGDAVAWRHTMRGGELQPAILSAQFQDPTPIEEFLPSVAALHTSWLLAGPIFERYEPTTSAAYEASFHLGYNFYLSSLSITSRPNNISYEVLACITNTGVAPFYYPLYVRASINEGDEHVLEGSPNSYGGGSSACVSSVFPNALTTNPIFLGNSNVDWMGRVAIEMKRNRETGALIIRGSTKSQQNVSNL
ncbi:hypothetical protein PROFUN_14714 [Planoprotostelium fungivorum]|uniref:DUF4832 domain-containing protein n=1 Tax=Planoprotostelium fungivorum TaxID=1890364 RepID=A0A2P6MZ55_9EUKA|nr:hypothetical protein PROFUN_14714 [Planoprotostelium fungivorum]